MAENSKIQWTTHTFNPWRGCTKVSDGCTNCYAETMSGRNPKTLGVWGKYGTRVVASDSMWKQPLKWNKEAGRYPDQCLKCGVRLSYEAQRMIQESERSVPICPSQKNAEGKFDPQNVPKCGGEIAQNVRPRVFCASLADVFEGEDTMPESSWRDVREARRRLFDLIVATPNLDWLLLTKRPENIEWALKTAYPTIFGLNLSGANTFIDAWMDRVWIGTSVENQEQAGKRIPELLKVKARVRFLSMEPLLGPVSLRWLPAWRREDGSLTALRSDAIDVATRSRNTNHLDGLRELDWIIVGGESGGHKRPMDADWARTVRDQCNEAGVSFFMKQIDKVQPIPPDLMIREFPNGS